MPGPPRGPSQRMITTSPAPMSPPCTAANASSSHSNTRAGPLNDIRSLPAIFMTHPSGARLPLQNQEPPSLLHRALDRADDLLARTLLGTRDLLR